MPNRLHVPSRGAASLLVLLALAGASPARADRPESTPGVPAVAQYGSRNGVVAVSHPLGAEAGRAMLAAGGNAVDAAAAILFALNVVEPQFLGIGGGGFMMIHLARTGETLVVDSREKAPAAATPDMLASFTDFATPSTSGVSVGVPGAVRGIALALDRWGTMPLARVLEPGIRLAEEGHRINPILEANIVDTSRGVVMPVLQPETAALFFPGGRPLKTGSRLVQPDLARTFRLLAQGGPEVFYTGEIAQAIVDAQARTRGGAAGVGRMTLADLASYRPAIRRPVTGHYRGYQIVSMPPPSSGGLTIIQMLEMLERFPLGDPGAGFGFGAKNTLHVMIEAIRLAFSDRAVWMGDEDFVHVPKVGLLARPYVASRSALIDLATRLPSVAAGNPLPYDGAPPPHRASSGPVEEQDEPGHTTHFAVVDREGNIVSYTTTIESLFGAGITVPGYGFLLNNELTDFNFVPARNDATGNPGANDVAANKRPRSSMSPTLLFKDGRPFASFGSPGGATIINSVFQVTLNLLDHGMTIQEAIDAPRISSSASGTVACEVGPLTPIGFRPQPELSEAVLQGLRAMGHVIPGCQPSGIGSVQGVVIDLESGRQFGGADPRRQGTVLLLPQHPHGSAAMAPKRSTTDQSDSMPETASRALTRHQ